MVKFGKQLESELVPEWREAYCTYKDLKRDVKRIKHQRNTGPTFTRTGSIGLLQSIVSFKHNSRTISGPLRPDKISFSPRGQPRDVIVIHKDGDVYETELLEPLVHAPQDRTFFRRLDIQLNKVNRFYKKKEAEYVTQAGRLEKQMLALIEMQEALARQGLGSPGFPKHLYDSKESQQAEKHVSDETPLIDENLRSDEFHMQNLLMEPSVIHEDTTYPGGEQEEEGELEGIIQSFIASVASTTPRERISPGSRDNPDLEAFSILSETKPTFRRASSNRVEFAPNGVDNSGKRLPRSAMKKRSLTIEPTRTEQNILGEREKVGNLSSESKEIEVVVIHPDVKEERQVPVFTQKKLNHAMKLLRMAFIEFYRGLGLLKSYSSLNMLAFAKIMKKYDKVTRWNLSRLYVKEVESSYFATSGKTTKLINKVEDIFTNHFADGVRKKAITLLRPARQHDSHNITFFLGIFSGCSFALLLAFISLVINPMSFQSAGGSNIGGQNYIDSVFPVFSTLVLILFHIYLYGWNVYTWQRTRINYPFIFEFSPGTELRYREVLLVSTGFTNLLFGGMCIHVLVSSRDFPRNYASEFIPLVIVLLFVVALFLPFNVLYRSSRVFFLRCFQRLFFSPLYKVVLSDFFLGDQLTSQVLVFRNIEFIFCYYTGGFFKSRSSQECTTNTAYRDLAYVVALLPYWWRFLQCMRRWFDERDKKQLANAGKYMSAMVAVAFRLTYKYSMYNVAWLVLFILASIVATLYTLYWDLVVDWGLLNRKSKNRWLRDELILKRKYLYFISMGVNTTLRLAWLFSLLRIAVPAHQDAFDILVAGLEVFRRGMWNFYRIENEHLNNVGKYRAVKTVPLPFKEFENMR